MSRTTVVDAGFSKGRLSDAGGPDGGLRRDPDYLTGTAALERAVRADAERVAASAGLVLLTPACLAAGRLEDGLRLLADSGLPPVLLRRVVLTEDHVRRIWRFQAAGFAPERFDVAVRLFRAGPAVAAVVTGPSGGQTVAERLAALKGPSDPRELAPDHLRRRLGAPNKINNLLHAADSVPAVVREAAIVLDAESLQTAWRAVRAGEAAPDLERFSETSRAAIRPDGVSLAHVAVRLRWRAFDLARALVAEDPPDGLRDALLDQLEWSREVPPADAYDALAGWRDRFLGSAVHEGFAAWLRDAPGAGALDRALAGLGAVLAERPVEIVELERDLRASGLGADEWEILAVATEAVTQDVRRAEGGEAG